MREAVRAAWLRLNADLEGRCSWMYLCQAGRVTTAVGVMIDDPSSALALPWERPDGSAATRHEIANAWLRVKQAKHMTNAGGGAFAPLTSLRLSEEAIDRLVFAKLSEIDRQLEGYFQTYSGAGSDAQAGLCMMAWAMGAHRFRAAGKDGGYPNFSAAFDAGGPDGLAICADEAHMDDGTGEHTKRPHVDHSLVKRNARVRVLFRNAAIVAGEGRDPAPLRWPDELWPE